MTNSGLKVTNSGLKVTNSGLKVTNSGANKSRIHRLTVTNKSS